jgi:addiction module RelE/StbE family toxin
MPEKKPLEWSPKSQRNIEFIRDYIAADNPTAAQSVIDEIRRAADNLRSFPMIGHEGKRAGTRELALTKFPYTIVYRLTPKKIGIVVVLHQARQYP